MPRSYACIDAASHPRPSGDDPHARIQDMDLDGIDATCLYPAPGATAASTPRARNLWLAEYCAACPDRLFGIAAVPAQSVDAMIAELAIARHDLGLRGVVIRPADHAQPLDHPGYARFWQAMADLAMPVCFHESSPREAAAACLAMVCGGVCDRHPDLRVGFLAPDGAWIVPWLQRADRHYEANGFAAPPLSMRPSEIFQRNCWIGCDPAGGNLKLLADYLGPRKLLWSGNNRPGIPVLLRQKLAGLSESTRHQILAGGARTFYGLP
jgi:predicted TIM-barrel fold metal-dependent hydrolase